MVEENVILYYHYYSFILLNCIDNIKLCLFEWILEIKVSIYRGVRLKQSLSLNTSVPQVPENRTTNRRAYGTRFLNQRHMGPSALMLDNIAYIVQTLLPLSVFSFFCICLCGLAKGERPFQQFSQLPSAIICVIVGNSVLCII